MSFARLPNLSIFGVLAALLCAPSAAFAFKVAYTVGGDGSCDFSDIQAAVAAAAANPPHNIFIAANKTYTTEKITINNLDLAITGGFTSCADSLAPSGNTTVSGAGNGGQDSVFSITGTSNVFLSNLSITGGNLPTGKTGGGIAFIGNGSLTVSDSSVFNNNAGSGAGIEVNGTGGNATLTIGENMFITGNKSSDLGNGSDADGGGGGIRVEGNARLFIVADGVFIAQNRAINGNGGGVQVVGPARADIGSPGAGNAGVISDNHAVNGGGVSVDAGQGGGLDAVLRLFGTDSTRLARISSNVASNVGGGIYLKPFSSTLGPDVFATVCAHDYRIDANAAMEGSAIYADTNSSIGSGGPAGGNIILTTDIGEREFGGCDPEPPESVGAVACTLGANCNMIDGNQAIDINNNNSPTDGATIFEQDGSELVADQLMLRANSGGYAVRETGDFTFDNLTNCLFAENQLGHELIFGDSGAMLDIFNCTFANDTIGAADVIRNDQEVFLSNSIIEEAGTATLHYLGDAGNLQVSYILANDISTLPSDPSIVVGNPLFVDMAHGDYRLSATKVGSTIFASPAIDFAPAVTGDQDIAGNPHDQDVGAIANRFGIRDLGAYEMQPITDRIFADGFGDPISIVF